MNGFTNRGKYIADLPYGSMEKYLPVQRLSARRLTHHGQMYGWKLHDWESEDGKETESTQHGHIQPKSDHRVDLNQIQVDDLELLADGGNRLFPRGRIIMCSLVVNFWIHQEGG